MRHTSIPALSILLTVTLSGNLTHAAEEVPEIAPPKSWDTFVILMWQYQTDVLRDQDIYRSLNINGFHVDRRNDETVAFGKKNGWPFYVDHAADKGYLHLGDNADNPKVSAVTRKRDLIVRPNSLADPATIEKLHQFLAERIGAAKDSTAVGYAFDDEISLGNFCSPAEVDISPQSIALYRQQLKQQYHTIDALNAQYGTKYSAFNEVNPTGFESVRQQLTSAGIGQVNLSAWCDWRSAMDTHFADVLTDLTRFSNTIDNTVPAGFVGGQAPSPWGGYDWRKLSKAIQWVECYDIGGSNTILRSFWSQKRAHVQTFFSSKNSHLDAWFLWYYLCQGNRGVIVWPEGWIVDGKPADHITALAPTFKEIQGPVSKTIIDGEFQSDPVAIYYSHPSIQMSWAMDSACHEKTWPNRLSSMDNAISTGGLSRIAWIKSLQDAGVQPTFIHQDHLLDGALTKRGFKVLILNRTLCLSDDEAKAIMLFAKNGGTVIADHLCGIFDEHGKARTVGALDDLFSVKRELNAGWFNGTDLTEVNGELGGRLTEKNWALDVPRAYNMATVERGLTAAGKAKSETIASTTVLVRNDQSTYLNISPIGYLLHRSDDQGKAWLGLVSQLLDEAGVDKKVTISTDGKPAPLMESVFWKNGDSTTLCVVKNIDRSATINSFGDIKGGIGDGAYEITIEFTKSVKDLKNERTGQSMGSGKLFTDTFVPWEANVYSFSP